MSRYRPPRARRTAIITPEGEQLLRQELQTLWQDERPVVTQAVSDAARNGDRSENGDYIYGKKRLREIDSRVRFLRKRLDSLQVAGEVPADPAKIYFGAWIRLQDEDDQTLVHRIVGPDEFDRQPEFISIDGPLARALLGKSRDDEITVQTPKGERLFWIDAIDYSGEQRPAGW